MIKIAHACVRSAFGILEVGALYFVHHLNNAGVFEFNPLVEAALAYVYRALYDGHF